MGNAERQKSLDHAGGVSHGLPKHQRQYRQRRAIHPGLPLDQPQHKIPAIVDHDTDSGSPLKLFESGAILIYLAEKFQRFLPVSGPTRHTTIQWLMFQMGGAGPIFGQVHHFLRAAPVPIPYAIDRYQKETARLYGVLDSHLSNNEFFSEDYSIADIATYPWVARHEWHKIELTNYPSVLRWYETIGDREAVKKGMTVPFVN